MGNMHSQQPWRRWAGEIRSQNYNNLSTVSAFFPRERATLSARDAKELQIEKMLLNRFPEPV